jgi:hypothetical protein
MCVPSAHDPIAADRNHPPSPGPPTAQIAQLCAYHGNAATPLSPTQADQARALQNFSITQCDAVRKLAGIRPVADGPDQP